MMREDILSELEKSGARRLKLRQRMAGILASCPRAGSGVHRWLFVTALKLHHYCRDEAELARLITLGCSDCGRDVSEQEIDDAVYNSQPIAEGTVRNRGQPPWPERNEERIEAITKAGPDLAGLEARSPMRWSDGNPHAEEIVGRLFPSNSLICVGKTKCEFRTGPLESWQHFSLLRQMQFLVPSPMTARTGRKQSGGQSQHTLDNTGPRRFLVIEFDPKKWELLSAAEKKGFDSEKSYYESKRDEQAALLWHLGTKAPLAMVVYSGGKSLHGWFFCEGIPEDTVLVFMRIAVSLGADPMTCNNTQFCRMPDGLRDNGKRQRVVFFNPQVLEAKCH